MHATRARLPQKRSRAAQSGATKPAAAKSAAKKTSAKKVAAPAILAEALVVPRLLPEGVAVLAAHRDARPQRQIQPVEIFALVEWIAPARDCWRRGELEVRRSACMPMSATRLPDGTIALTDLPGQGDPLILDATAITGLAGAALVRALPGMRVTITGDDLAPALPPRRAPAAILPFPQRAAARP